MTYRGTHSHNSKIQIESTLQQNNVRVGGRRRGLWGERRGGRERRGVGVGAGICPELEPEISKMGGSVNPVGNAYKQQVIVLPEYRGSRWFRWLSPWFLCELKLFSAALCKHVPVQHKICKNRKIFFFETYLMNGIHLGPWVTVLNNFAKKLVFVKIFEF